LLPTGAGRRAERLCALRRYGLSDTSARMDAAGRPAYQTTSHLKLLTYCPECAEREFGDS